MESKVDKSRYFAFGIVMLFVLAGLSLSIQKAPKQELFRVMPYRIVSDTINPDLSDKEGKVKFIINSAQQFNFMETPIFMKTSVNGVWKEKELQGNSFEYMVEPGNYAFNLLIDSMYYEVIIPKIVVKPQHDLTVKVSFYPRPKSIDKQRGNIMLEKPVIYTYTDEEVPLSISIEPKGDFSFTYPETMGTWNGTATKNGFKLNGTTYPYLFWEAEMDRKAVSNWDRSTVVAKNEVLGYLEQVCQKVGLNTKEKTDLITYWGPRMMKYDKIEVLALTENIDELYGELSVSDKRFDILRFYMVFRETERSSSKLILQNLKKFNRSNKHILEWGGADLTSQTL